MEYKVELSTAGMGSGVIMIAEEELSKMEWRAEYRGNHELRVRSYAFFERKTKRHGWKRTGKIGGWNRRENTLSDMPGPPPELCDMAIKRWGDICVNWTDWNVR